MRQELKRQQGRRHCVSGRWPILCCLLVGLLLVSAAQADYPRYSSRGSTYVPLDSWVYPAFERLAAFGYAPTAMLGMRPWTRLECARLLAETEELLRHDGEALSEAHRLFYALNQAFAAETGVLAGFPNRSLVLESLYARTVVITGRPLTDGYHFGQTLAHDYGRPFEEGASIVSGISARGSFGPFVAYLRGEYQGAPGAPAVPQHVLDRIAIVDSLPEPLRSRELPHVRRLRLLDSYVGTSLANWQITAGLHSFWWGPTESGSLILGNNAEPIPMVRISRTAPFLLPGFLRVVGPMRTEFFVGRLSGHQHVIQEIDTVNTYFPRPLERQPYFHGQKLSFKPTPNLEFGVSRTAIFSGPGIPFTPRTFARSMLGYGNVFGDDDPGDRRSGFDFSYRVPRLRQWLVLYNEAMAEDEPSPIGHPLRSAMNPGIYMPQLPKLPKMDFRAEGFYTDLPDGVIFPGFYYFNVRYVDGYTHRGGFLGHPAGRQGHGVHFSSRYWFSPASTLQVAFRRQSVSTDFLDGGSLWRLSAHLHAPLTPDLYLSTFGQYERWSFPLLAAGTESNAAFSVQLSYSPGRRQ